MENTTGKKWKWLTDSIPAGRADAVSMPYLARINRITEREVRKAIEQARREGILICSCEDGYFMPETIYEIKAHVHRARSRIRTGSECLEPFLAELNRIGSDKNA